MGPETRQSTASLISFSNFLTKTCKGILNDGCCENLSCIPLYGQFIIYQRNLFIRILVYWLIDRTESSTYQLGRKYKFALMDGKSPFRYDVGFLREQNWVNYFLRALCGCCSWLSLFIPIITTLGIRTQSLILRMGHIEHLHKSSSYVAAAKEAELKNAAWHGCASASHSLGTPKTSSTHNYCTDYAKRWTSSCP